MGARLVRLYHAYKFYLPVAIQVFFLYHSRVRIASKRCRTLPWRTKLNYPTFMWRFRLSPCGAQIEPIFQNPNDHVYMSVL